MKTQVALAVVAGILAGIALTHFFRDRSPAGELKYRARNEKISRDDVERELGLLRAQFGDDQHWRAALRVNHLWTWQLRREIAEHLRSRAWLDRRLHLAVSDDECREYFVSNQSRFMQPARYRVAHLFLAAPAGTPNEIVDAKRRTMDELAQRLQRGEQLVDLAAQFSEDEATKQRGGDLGWFSDARMPADFMNAVHALRVGETSAVVQTKLGFHILRLLDARPARAMSFDEARPEIIAALENAKRRDAVARLDVDLASKPRVVQSH